MGSEFDASGRSGSSGRIFAALDAVLPAHVPGRGHRAEVAFAQGKLDVAEALVAPLLEASDDPEYRALYAEILAVRGDGRSARHAELAAEAYERLWRIGPKPMPTTRRLSSWGSAIGQSERSSWPWSI